MDSPEGNGAVESRSMTQPSFSDPYHGHNGVEPNTDTLKNTATLALDVATTSSPISGHSKVPAVPKTPAPTRKRRNSVEGQNAPGSSKKRKKTIVPQDRAPLSATASSASSGPAIYDPTVQNAAPASNQGNEPRSGVITLEQLGPVLDEAGLRRWLQQRGPVTNIIGYDDRTQNADGKVRSSDDHSDVNFHIQPTAGPLGAPKGPSVAKGFDRKE